MSENFQSWVDRLARDPKNAKPLTAGEVVQSSSGEPFGAVQFVGIQKTEFAAEVGKKGKYYIYHIWPADKWLGRITDFYQPMAEAFEELFKDHGEIEVDWVEEMRSWTLRVSGWTDNIWGDELAIRVLDLLDDKLKSKEASYASKPLS